MPYQKILRVWNPSGRATWKDFTIPQDYSNFVFLCHDSAIRASTMALAAPSVRKNPNKFGFSLT